MRLVEQQWNNKKLGTSHNLCFVSFFAWLHSYLQETEEPSSLWGTIKLSAHCCSAIINVALHCLPLVAYVRRMNTQCTQLQPFSSERGDNCHSHFCQIERTYPTSSVCPQTAFMSRKQYKLLFVALSLVTWAGLLYLLCSLVLCLVHYAVNW